MPDNYWVEKVEKNCLWCITFCSWCPKQALNHEFFGSRHGEFLWNIFYVRTLHIHNWLLQPFSQDYSLVSHTTHVVCLNFIREWRDLQFNVDFEQQIFEKLFQSRIYLPSECLSEICWEEIAEEIFVFHISFWWLTWNMNPGLTSNKPTHYLLDYGYFTYIHA